jgi:uncharacterized protein YcgI (DUF1989 family)
MAAKKKIVEKVDEKEVVATPVVETRKILSVRLKKGNTYVVVDFTPEVQGPDFEKIGRYYAKTMGGEVV